MNSFFYSKSGRKPKMKIFRTLLICFSLCFSFCTPFKKSRENSALKSSEVLVIGHRGYAGKLPENSLPGFIRAVKKGADGVELDVVISKDKKVVVSHEPYMASDYMAKPDANAIAHKDERSFNLYKMNYADIKDFPLGLRRNKRFPSQRRIKTYKPLLSEVFENVEHLIESNELEPILYFVEIKSDPNEYGVFQPYPEELVKLVVEVVKEKNLLKNVIFQSFDPAILNELQEKYPEVSKSFLVKNGKPEDNLNLLSFKPQVYAPHHKLVTNKEYVDYLHQRNIMVIPWTLNSIKNVEQLIGFGVDGIISDYPQRFQKKL